MKRSLIVVAYVLFAIPAIGQQPFFQHYTLLDKKSDLQANVMFQDRDGYIWFGTTGGLVRFDGQTYKRYKVSDSLADNNVTAIASDAAGRLWLGSNNGAIHTFKDDKFNRFDPEEGTTAERISDILFDSEGSLWFSTFNDGIYHFTNDRLYRVDEQEGMPDLYVYDLAIDASGNILAGTDGGVAVCSRKGTKVTISVLDHNKGLQDDIVRKVVVTNDGYWLGTQDRGIIHYASATGEFRAVTSDWKYGAVADAVLKGTQLWIATQKGLVMLEGDGITAYGDRVAAEGMAVSTLLIDKEENIWAASRAGVIRTPGNGIEFIHHFKGTEDQNILAVTSDDQGYFWFSTSRGLFRTRRDHLQGDAENILKQSGYAKSSVISLCYHKGFIWAGLYGEGVLRINTRTRKITRYRDELRNGNILGISADGESLWLATLGGGTRVSDPDGVPSFTHNSRAEGLSSDFIYQVFADSKGRVWFATDGKGVDVLEQGKIRNIQAGLPSKVVYAVAEDAKGDIWVNIQGNGLFVFDGSAAFRRASSALATRKAELHAIASDSEGNILSFHDEGLDLINPSTKRIKYLGEEAGFTGMVANLNAVGKGSNGELLIGTSAGVIDYRNGSQHLRHLPAAKIASIRIFDRTLRVSEIGDLEHDDNNLTFHYTGLWFQNSRNLFYRYRLDNFDRDWIHTRDGQVTYSRLPPGQYVFKVQVSENDSFENAQETFVAFVIHPPFWRTNTFYLLASIVLFGTGYGFLKYRERKLRHDNLILEARVKARTVEVQRQNDEIQAQNEEITAQAEEIRGINENLEMMVKERTSELERKNKALEEYAFINAHKLRSPVASILGLAHLLAKTNLDDEGKEINRHLQQSADELDDIVRSITKAIERAEKQPYEKP